MGQLEDDARKRFRELTARQDRIRAVSTPLREARDEHVKAARETEDAMNAKIAEAETGLFDLEMEIGRIVRFLTPSGSNIAQTGDRGTEDDIPPDPKA